MPILLPQSLHPKCQLYNLPHKFIVFRKLLKIIKSYLFSILNYVLPFDYWSNSSEMLHAHFAFNYLFGECTVLDLVRLLDMLWRCGAALLYELPAPCLEGDSFSTHLSDIPCDN